MATEQVRHGGDVRTEPVGDEKAARLPTDDARQGETGHHVRYILMIGVALVVIAFAVVIAITGRPPNAP